MTAQSPPPPGHLPHLALTFAVAPWPPLLWSISILGTLLLCGVGFGARLAVPPAATVPVAHTVGLLVAIVPPAIALGASLFVVRGFTLLPGELRVRRLLWTTRVPLNGLRDARAVPDLLRGSFRTAGNGGLFSFTGRYRHRTLGPYRAFLTDWRRAVVLALADGAVVLSPADPVAFVQSVRRLHGLAAGP